MISFSRSLARQFRAVARRAGLSARHAGYVRLVATPDALSVYAANHRVAVEYRDGGRFITADLTVPLQLFADCEGKNGDLVTIRLGEPGQIVTTWDEGGLPQHRVYQFADDASIPKCLIDLSRVTDWRQHGSGIACWQRCLEFGRLTAECQIDQQFAALNDAHLIATVTVPVHGEW